PMRKTPPAPAVETRAKSEDVHSGLSPATIARAFRDNLAYRQARFSAVATPNDNYMALAYSVRDRLLHRWINSARTYFERRSRTVCYLSAEFLLGRNWGTTSSTWASTIRCARRSRTWGSTSMSCWNKRRNPAWAMADWAAWPHVSSTHSPRWRFRALDMAFATSLGSSTRRSAMAGRWNSQTNG